MQLTKRPETALTGAGRFPEQLPTAMRDTAGSISPVVFTGQLTVAENNKAAVDGSTIKVPPGKRLVIDQVSFLVQAPSGQRPLWSLSLDVNSVWAGHLFPLMHVWTEGPRDVFSGTFQTRIVADSDVAAVLLLNTFDGGAWGSFAVSGHFVDLQQC